GSGDAVPITGQFVDMDIGIDQPAAPQDLEKQPRDQAIAHDKTRTAGITSAVAKVSSKQLEPQPYRLRRALGTNKRLGLGPGHHHAAKDSKLAHPRRWQSDPGAEKTRNNGDRLERAAAACRAWLVASIGRRRQNRADQHVG